MDALTFRSACDADREFAYSVKVAAFRVYAEQVWGWDAAEQRRLHERRFDAQDCRIVRLGDADVGFMALEHEHDCLRLNQLFLLPEHQGRGVGRSCMLGLLDEARRRGVPVRLRVLRVNPRALAFYERIGFRHVGATETHHLLESPT